MSPEGDSPLVLFSMEWQAVVLVVQILLLAIGYFLFQQARAELSARAAETPVLSEVKALQRSVKQLLADIEDTSDATSARLENRCAEAQSLLLALERRLAEIEDASGRLTFAAQQAASPVVPARSTETAAVRTSATPTIVQGITVATPNYNPPAADKNTPTPRERQRQTVYALADAGETPASIAHATSLSEGEVETLLGLRVQRR